MPNELEKPDLSSVPMLFRRRLSSLSKSAFVTFIELSDQVDLSQLPGVFVSRFAEMDMSLKMIGELQQNQAISPAKFSTSVHNSLAGQFSIFYKNQQSIKALSAGPYSLANGLIESLSISSTESKATLLSISEGNFPAEYKSYTESRSEPFALSLVLDSMGNDISWEVIEESIPETESWQSLGQFSRSKSAGESIKLPLSKKSALHLWR
ncbi:MAG: beta-ketoacyl synthase chain length factor [Lentisphaeraceae bacterium]|nr:beta-ketoacyl synthase chain length factor [Lentisphaeraceae bacterium]